MELEPVTQDTRIRGWLESREGQALLRSAAASVLEEALRRNLSPRFLKITNLRGAGRGEIIEEIVQELCLFILEKQKSLEKFLAMETNPGPYLRTAFINHWLDSTRGPEKDPWRHLYKRAGDVLRNSRQFHTLARPRGGTSYTMARESRQTAGLALEDMKRIPFPGHVLSRLDPDQAARHIPELAAHFWKEACALFAGIAVWVKVKDLIDWIGLHVVLTSPRVAVETHKEAQIEGLAGDLPERPDAAFFDPARVEAWAGCFAAGLKQKERQAAYLRFCEERTLEDVARIMGYGPASAPAYVLARFQEKLKTFLRDLPWLSPDDLNEEAFSLFRGKLCEDLKDSLKEP